MLFPAFISEHISRLMSEAIEGATKMRTVSHIKHHETA